MSMVGMPSGTSNVCTNGHYYYGSNVIMTRLGRRCRACVDTTKARAAAKKRQERAALRDPEPVLDTRWRAQAGCQGADPRLFEPFTKAEVTASAGDPQRLGRVQAALSYCDVCPVRERCLAWARATGEQGVWGGEYLSREGRLKNGAA